jgi:hypothetical protein
VKNEASNSKRTNEALFSVCNVDLIVPKNELSSGSSVNRRQFPQPAQLTLVIRSQREIDSLLSHVEDLLTSTIIACSVSTAVVKVGPAHGAARESERRRRGKSSNAKIGNSCK